MGATIKDIARQLKISTSTVSYALNGGPRNVPESVRDEVLRVARELNYRPNRIAKSLVTRRSNTVGLMPTEANPDLTNSPYFQICFNAILNQAEAKAQDVLVFSRFIPKGPALESVLSTLCDGRADGIILLAPFVDSPLLRGLVQREVPFVVTSTETTEAISYTCDNRHGVSVAMNYLRSLGHRRIAHLAGHFGLHDAIERQDAVVSVARELGMEVRPEWIIQSLLNTDVAEEMLTSVLQSADRPTAILCFNDEIAMAAYRAANRLGMRIPADLSVIGFDNSFRCEHMSPALTSVEQPIAKIARCAFDALMALIEGESASSGRFETRLVLRDSACSPPGHLI
jgi:DNA-binding LacI/PurR family transcriptional regulator